uniref:sterol 3beta-glucosyltransferase n=3 Tax=Oryza glaberrima TaxID=4538 RepID=I1QA62_ORYGL
MRGASAGGGGGEGFGGASSVSNNISLPNEGPSPRGTDNAECSETSSDRSNSESIKPEESAMPSSIFDKKISIKKKLRLLSRMAILKDDGTVEVDIPTNAEAASLDLSSNDYCNEAFSGEPLASSDFQHRPPMQIVMLIVGTRGDVQPFIAIGKRLQIYGHRVRLATHANFKDFVVTAGLDFYPLGGDPKLLAGYMVKNKGFLPATPSEIPIQRKEIKEIIFSLLPACKDPDTDTGAPFNVDAIIANPAAYGHVHVAEALKVPIHIIFTMPWTPTCEFPHPFSRVKQPAGYRLSYQIVDSFVWLGIRDIINDFRKRKLKLRPVTYLSSTHAYSNDIPHAYIWSPYLVPKPKDWGPKIDVVGFCFLDLASNYKPPEPLLKWIESGEKPIYIGFGSLPIPEPDKLTRIIVEALEITGQRGIINKGWGGLGNLEEPKEFVYVIDNIPHDWLFLQCKAVVHHGGAGTTAASLKAACPTTIVPFFGDQFFWGNMVHARGLGAPPVPVEQLQLHLLVDAIKFMMDPKVKERAVELAKAIESEDGVDGAVKAFLKHLPQPRSLEKPQPAPPSSTFMHPFLLPVKRCFGIAT